MSFIAEDRDEKDYEQTHVHDVYNSIASHFSQTRYKPWPIVDQFLKNLAPGSVGLDIGCGNGKYLVVRDDIFIVGSDRSEELAKIAKTHEHHDALIGDALNPPHPSGRFDFVISIAVLHHLSLRARRIEGVRAALYQLRKPQLRSTGEREAAKQDECLQKETHGGEALFFVWALEQKGSRRGWDAGGEQDVLVPWILKSPTQSSKQSSHETKTKRQAQKNKSGFSTCKILKRPAGEGSDGTYSSGAARDEIPNTPNGHDQQPSNANSNNNKILESKESEKVFHRYYHLYRQGELEEDIVSAGGEIVSNGYDRDNWWCVAKRKSQ